MKKKNRLQMLAALLAATLSMALTSPIAAKANEEYNVSQHHQAYSGSGNHFAGGNYMDHTHIYNIHVPYIYD